METLGKMMSRVLNADFEKAFGGIVAEYAAEVFQETYDAEALKRKIEVIRTAQKRIRAKRMHDENMIDRLERMGEFYDKEYGVDLMPKALQKAPKAPTRGGPK